MSAAGLAAGCFVMMIKITSSGGFGGLAAAGIDKQMDLESQTAALRDTYCTAFDPKALGALATKAEAPGAADMLTYRIVVTDDEKARHTFELREDQLPPALLDLIDAM